MFLAAWRKHMIKAWGRTRGGRLMNWNIWWKRNGQCFFVVIQERPIQGLNPYCIIHLKASLHGPQVGRSFGHTGNTVFEWKSYSDLLSFGTLKKTDSAVTVWLWMAQTRLVWCFQEAAVACSTDFRSLPRFPHASEIFLGEREELMLSGCWRATTETSSNCNNTSWLTVTCLSRIGKHRSIDLGIDYKKSSRLSWSVALFSHTASYLACFTASQQKIMEEIPPRKPRGLAIPFEVLSSSSPTDF